MKDLFTTFLSTGLIQAANLATGILAARLLLPEGRGELALLILWPSLIVSLGALGLNTAAAFHSAREPDRRRQIFAATTIIAAFLSPVLMAVFALLIPYLFAGQRPEIVSAAWIYLALIPVHIFSLSYVSLFQGAHAFTAFNALRCTVHFAYLLVILAFIAVYDASVAAFANAFLAANILSLIAALGLAVRYRWTGLATDVATVWAMLRYGIRSHVSVVLAIANQRLDQALISVALAASDLGLYVVALTVAGLSRLLTGTMEALVFPKISAQQAEHLRVAILGRYLRATLLLVVPTVIVLVAIAPWLIGILFGEAFVPASTVTRILLLTGIPYAFHILLSAYLRASDRMMTISKAETLGIVATAASLAALVPTLGIVGAAIAQVFAFTIPAVFITIRIRRDLEVDVLALLRFDGSDFRVLRESLPWAKADPE